MALLLAGGDRGNGKVSIFRSTNNGFTWSSSNSPPNGEVWGQIARVSLLIHDNFAENGRALAATGGFDCGVSYTTDHGNIWSHNAVIDTDIKVLFSKPMNRNVTAPAHTISPQIEHRVFWSENNRLMIIHPVVPWQRDTRYEITITKDARAQDGTNMGKDFNFTFVTASP